MMFCFNCYLLMCKCISLQFKQVVVKGIYILMMLFLVCQIQQNTFNFPNSARIYNTLYKVRK